MPGKMPPSSRFKGTPNGVYVPSFQNKGVDDCLEAWHRKPGNEFALDLGVVSQRETKEWTKFTHLARRVKFKDYLQSTAALTLTPRGRASSLRVRQALSNETKRII